MPPLRRPAGRQHGGIRFKLLALLVLLAAGHVGYAYWCAWALYEGVRWSDPARLEAYVDWPDLRESIKRQALGERTAGTSPLGEALGRLLVGGVVDAVLTPQRLADLLRLAGPDGDVRDPEQMKRQVRYAFLTGPFDFRVSLGEPGSRAESWTHADFRFQGDAWRLVALRLPAA
jgi:hypothetical protein